MLSMPGAIRVLRWVSKTVLAAAASLVLSLAAYLVAAVLLGVVPQNGDWRPSPDGIDVYFTTNGVHADLIVPVHAIDVDWAVRLSMEELQSPDGLTEDIAFGWGDRGFYLETPTWADFHASTAFMALTGLDTSVLHAEAVPIPEIDHDVLEHDVVRKPVPTFRHHALDAKTRHMRLSETQYRRLAAFIENSFEHGSGGDVIAIPGAHYRFGDAFFEAKGHYSLFMTCNEWVRRALLAAGVRVPLWSPFDKALLYQLLPDEPPSE